MTSLDQKSICHMFDRIAPTYDMVNRLLSLRQDVRWRRYAARMVSSKPQMRVLDVATGTADMLLALCEACPDISEAVGVDLAEKMLDAGQRKAERSPFFNKIKLLKADATDLPFPNAYFDLVTISFGIRNVERFEAALQEFLRVLKPSGTLLILEFSLPQNFLVRWFYLAYFRYILPFLGGVFSRDKNAYRYLNKTVESFPHSDRFNAILQRSGFKDVTQEPLTFGIASMYRARVS